MPITPGCQPSPCTTRPWSCRGIEEFACHPPGFFRHLILEPAPARRSPPPIAEREGAPRRRSEPRGG